MIQSSGQLTFLLPHCHNMASSSSLQQTHAVAIWPFVIFLIWFLEISKEDCEISAFLMIKTEVWLWK